MSFHYRRRRRYDDQHGVDDWLMTYADMITLLLCFFAVFLSVSVPRKEAFDAARETVLERFADPQTLMEGKFPVPPGTSQSGGMNDKLPSIIDRYHTSDSESTEAGFDGPQTPQEEKPEGDRLITMEMPSAAFFDSGSATLSREGRGLLSELVNAELKSGKFDDYTITVEGHTDNVPINTAQFPSNWELSTARAAAVVRYFIEQGIAPNRLRAAGYADSLPKEPNKDATGILIPENQRQNRRVVIKLEKIEPGKQ